MAWTFDRTRAGYNNLWRTATLKGGADATAAESFANKIIAAESRYRAVQNSTGVPWFFIGALHMRESSCNFAGVLHNGERIIGTGRVTALVPAGRGPFSSWEEAAVDALRLKDMHRVQEWSVARMLFQAEVFNGLGYVGKGINSPYVWAGTNHEQRGKYVRDHVFDFNAEDTQLGVAAVLIRLGQLRSDIAADLTVPPKVTIPKPEKPPMADTPQDLQAQIKALRDQVTSVLAALDAIQAKVAAQPTSVPVVPPPIVVAPAPSPLTGLAGPGTKFGAILSVGLLIAQAFGILPPGIGELATQIGQGITATAVGAPVVGATGIFDGFLKRLFG